MSTLSRDTCSRSRAFMNGVILMNSTGNGFGADLYVVRGDEQSEAALALVETKALDMVFVVEVNSADYLDTTRKVPQLMTSTGLYRGLPSVSEAIDREFIA